MNRRRLAAVLLRIHDGLGDAEIAAELQCDVRAAPAAAPASAPKTEDELIAEAIAAGRITRLPPAYAAEVTGAEPLGAGWHLAPLPNGDWRNRKWRTGRGKR